MDLKRKQNLILNVFSLLLIAVAIILTMLEIYPGSVIMNVKPLIAFLILSLILLVSFRRFEDNNILLLYHPFSIVAFLVYGPTFALTSFVVPIAVFLFMTEGKLFENLARIAVHFIKFFLGGILYFKLLQGSSGLNGRPVDILSAVLAITSMRAIEEIGNLLLDLSRKGALKIHRIEFSRWLKRFPFITAWSLTTAYLVGEGNYYFAAIMSIPAIHIYLYLSQEDKLKRTLNNVFFSLTRMINMRDHYTYQHSLSVAVYAKKVALELGYSQNFAENIYQMGLLHDIGKVGVSDTILLKQDRLTDDEFASMKEHPSLGVKLVKLMKFLDLGIDGIKYHHEFFDGSGYPDGLKGDEIPLTARIITVCDAWNAMRTDRPYRKAMPYTKAAEQIRRGAGTQFDPEIVRAALRVFEQEEPGVILSKTQIFMLEK